MPPTTTRNQKMNNVTVWDDSIIKSISTSIEKIKSDNHDQILQGVAKIRRLLSIETNAPIEPFLKAGGLPLLVNCLKLDDSPKIQAEAIWAITNIVIGRHFEFW